MFDLSLFPLKTVLFPGMPLYLHVFEDRYKQMIATCLERQEPFGVVLIEKGYEAFDPKAIPHAIGCTTQIARIEPLGEGRMKLMGIGQDRFRILALNHDHDYLVGEVELDPMHGKEPERLSFEGNRLRSWLTRYLTILNSAGHIDFDLDGLPDDPLLLAYLAATLLRTPTVQNDVQLGILIAAGNRLAQTPIQFRGFTAQQQLLLESTDAAAFLNDLCMIYRREVMFLSSILSTAEQSSQIDILSQN